jgi:cbb3-type cytochrome oxidase subunit 3
MSYFTPDQPWLYLLLYGIMMTIILIAGIIIYLNRRKKGKAKPDDEAKEGE